MVKPESFGDTCLAMFDLWMRGDRMDAWMQKLCGTTAEVETMDILVTGGSGTIGGYVLRELLEAGHAVLRRQLVHLSASRRLYPSAL